MGLRAFAPFSESTHLLGVLALGMLHHQGVVRFPERAHGAANTREVKHWHIVEVPHALPQLEDGMIVLLCEVTPRVRDTSLRLHSNATICSPYAFSRVKMMKYCMLNLIALHHVMLSLW